MGSFFITQIHPAMLHTATSLRLYTSSYFNANSTIIPLLSMAHMLSGCLHLYAFTRSCMYASTLVPLYACMPLRISAYTPLRIYASMALRLYALKPLRLYASTPPRLYACKIVVLYSAVSYWGGYNRHKREAEWSLQSQGWMLIFEACSVKKILTQTFQ